jgi:hypothetical protein
MFDFAAVMLLFCCRKGAVVLLLRCRSGVAMLS